MKILIINTSELVGGAAVAANRLFKALMVNGQTANELVRDKQTLDDSVFSLNTTIISRLLNKIRFFCERLVIFIANFFDRQNLFRVSIANTGIDISNHILVREADIIHLHWINQGFLSLFDIKNLLTLKKPIVWTLHDLWPATAICHYPDDCKKYQTGCNKCPLQKVSPFWDLAMWTFKRKQHIGLERIHFVGCSKWITEKAKKSSLLKGATFVTIPNPIDISLFKPLAKSEARAKFSLPDNKFLVLFTAAKLSDKRKGASFLIDACTRLKEKYESNLEIVLVGNDSDKFCDALPFKVNILGFISDQSTMVAAYSCADLFAIPSLEDNLPNTIMESMACGTPCVGFRIGGIPEMIDHKKNGYIAEYKDAYDLAAGIQWVLEHPNRHDLSELCERKVRENYSEQVVAEQYQKLYTGLLKKH